MTNKYLCEIYENVKVKNTNEPEFLREELDCTQPLTKVLLNF